MANSTEKECTSGNGLTPFGKPPRGRWKNNHPHAAPNPPVKRLILLLSEPGDLVVDPFAGGGNMLKQAQDQGRRILGYEIEPKWVSTSNRLLNLEPETENENV